MKSRLLGITIFGVLHIIFNTFGVLRFVSPYFFTAIDPQRNQMMGAMSLAFAMFGLAAVAGVAAGIGILRLNSRAHLLTVILSIIWLLYWGRLGLEGLTGPQGSETGLMAFIAGITMTWNLIVLWYFLRPSVKAQFQAARSRS